MSVVIGLNVCRNRHVDGGRQWTTWSQVDANFHDPLHFGHIVLSPTPEMIGKMSDEFRKGGLEGPIRVFGAEGFSGTTYLSLAAESLKGVEAMLAELDALRRAEKSPEVAKALERRIADAQKTLASIAEKVRTGKTFDAAEWMRADMMMQKLRTELGQAVWEARLEALLRSI